METMYLPTGPRKVSNAAMVRLTPWSGVPVPSEVPRTPEEAMTRPVIVQTMVVSKKVPVMLM